MTGRPGRAAAALGLALSLLVGLAACQTGRAGDDDLGAPADAASTPSAVAPTPTADGADAEPSPGTGSEPGAEQEADGDAGQGADRPAPGPTADGGGLRPAGTAEPYPSACVEAYVDHVALLGGGGLPAERPVGDPGGLLLYDRLTYRISGEEYLWYAVDRYVAPDRVPDEYRFPQDPVLEGPDPLTGILLQAMWESECLAPGALDELLGYVMTGELPPGHE